MSPHKNRPFLRRLSYALQGLAHSLRGEASLRLQAVVFAAVIVALIALRPAAVWWALVLLASAAVLAAELFNTAIEHLADVLHPEDSPGVRIVKDCAAATPSAPRTATSTPAAALLVHLLTGAP